MSTGPDLSEFFRLSKPKRKPCLVGFALTQLKKPERDQLEAALATDKGIITAAAVESWLRSRGHSTNIPAITSHRQERCTCYD